MERLTPEQAAERIAHEDHISIVFEDGFEEFGKTAEEFKHEIYGEERFEQACIGALLGGEFIYETFLNNSKYERNAIIDIVKYGDWDYIRLHDHKHPTDSNLIVGIWNQNKPYPHEESDESYRSTSRDEIRLTLNSKESYSVLSMVGDCIARGQIASDYQIERLEKLMEDIEDPFDGFKDDLEFEVQIVVRKRIDSSA
ncbi:hypothetical protein NDS46_30385 (plasmid) [Paenibacillus thiaminolyticus]|uniref:hypothetical protein n=1 Tax=Paenibacillus thiaminolyticus TaxID=49283 RepID=UPI00232F7E04|nr:hypothetical protein [Paenibacillus thiaminolyticus]WCF11657.1 hypothetical protein NDS46_30385 [Paenibacillus thiaminolyticus]